MYASGCHCTYVWAVGGLLFSVALTLFPGRAEAQTTEPKIYRACYIPGAGNIYRIGEEGLPASCLEASHVEFTWPELYMDVTSGNVGIGTPNPTATLDVEGDVHISEELKVGNSVTIDGVSNTISTGAGEALELHVGGGRALRLEPISGDHPNLIGGSAYNYVESGVIGATIGGGGSWDYENSVLSSWGTVGGGSLNSAGQGSFNTVGGGWANMASGGYATVGGGEENRADGGYATVGGGEKNRADGDYSAVPGGYNNHASGEGSYAAGSETTASGPYATAMGYNTEASGDYSMAIGYETKTGGAYATAMGHGTTADAHFSTAMGAGTKALDLYATAMGIASTASGNSSTAMGALTTASGGSSTAMGYNTTASGTASTAMGHETTASGDYSMAMGENASTNGQSGSFVYGDASSTTDVIAWHPNQFVVRASGGIALFTNSGLTTGCGLEPGSGDWACSSSKLLKTDIGAVDEDALLASLRELPIQTWSYKTELGVRHLGPFAEDFYQAFGLGARETAIGHFDIAGVNLAATQALDRRTRELQEQLELKDQEINELRAELGRLLNRIERLETQH